MKALPFLARCGFAVVLSAVFAAVLATAPFAAAQEDASTAKTQTQLFTLRHARAEEVATVLRSVFAAKPSDKARIAIGVDDRTNQLVVSGSPPLLADVAKLLQALDAPGAQALQGGRPLNVYRVRHLELDRKLEEALRILIPNAAAGHFVVDPQRKLVIVQGTLLVQDAVEALLARLDESPESVPRGLQVQVLWLVGGKLAKGDGTMPAGAFAELADDLAKLGMKQMRFAAHTMIQVTPGSSFTVSGGAALETPCVLKVSGKVVASGAETVSLQATASVMQTGDGASARLCDLQTQLRLPLGKLVVMGAAPLRGEPTVFLVQVIETGAAKAPAKKAAAATPSQPQP